MKILLALVVSATMVTGPVQQNQVSWWEGFRPCITEDQETSCYWDAQIHGNGKGRDFTVYNGEVWFYDNIEDGEPGSEKYDS